MGTAGQELIGGKMEELTRLERAIWLTRAAATFVAYASVIGACHFAVDWSVRPERALRAVLTAGLLAALGYALWKQVLVPLSRFPSRREIALQIERFYPVLRGRFISSYQLVRSGGGGSPALIARLVEETDHVVRTLDLRAVPERVTRNRMLGAAAALAVGWVGFVGLSPTARLSVPVWLARLANPLSAAPYPTKTRVVVEQGTGVVARGTDVELRARAAGMVPPRGTIAILRGGKRRTEMPVVGSGRDFVFIQKAVVESFDYFWRLGDGRSEQYHVEVVIPPEIRGVRVSYAYPAYTRRAPETVYGGNLEALPGTRAALAVQTNKPIRWGALVLDKGSSITLAREGETTYTVALDVVERGSYRLRLVDEYGFENRDPMEYVIQPVADEAPRVDLREMEERKFVTPYAALPVEIHCRDDYGIRGVQLHISMAGSDEKTIDVPIRPNRTDLTVAHTLRLEELGLEAGAEAVLWASAMDNREVGEPQRGVSGKVRLEVVSPEEMIRLMRERMESLFPRVEQITGEAVESKTSVEELLRQGGVGDQPTTGSR